MDRITIEQVLDRTHTIKKPDPGIRAAVKAGWDRVAKPIDSMGEFETLTAQIGAVLGTTDFTLEKTAILVFCADNGIVQEGVSQSDQSITAICAKNIAAGKSALGIMAKQIGCQVKVYDVGMNTDKDLPLVHNKKIRPGTRNFAKEPAMTKEEALRALQLGMDLVAEYREEGYELLGMGEMGIGNTTTSSAICAALLQRETDGLVGPGAGASHIQLSHKREVVEAAMKKYDLYEQDPFNILVAVGGYDIAALAGMCIGGAVYGMPIVLDGLISMCAALLAMCFAPGAEAYLLPSHEGKEPAVGAICETLHVHPVIRAGMALGEGTGAVMMISLLKTAHAIYRENFSFEDAGIIQYERF